MINEKIKEILDYPIKICTIIFVKNESEIDVYYSPKEKNIFLKTSVYGYNDGKWTNENLPFNENLNNSIEDFIDNIQEERKKNNLKIDYKIIWNDSPKI